tara:strand:+ start:76 stop:399 length:324 start_codon:yes stop_codon:yes gene_type:complete
MATTNNREDTMTAAERFPHLDAHALAMLQRYEEKRGVMSIPVADARVGQTIYENPARKHLSGEVLEVRASTVAERRDGHADVVAVVSSPFAGSAPYAVSGSLHVDPS